MRHFEDVNLPLRRSLQQLVAGLECRPHGAILGDRDPIGITAWRLKHVTGNLAILHTRDAVTGRLGEPHGSVRGDSEPTESNDRRVEWEAFDLTGRGHARDAASSCVGIPGAAVGCDAKSDWFHVVTRRRQPFELPRAYPS